MRIDRSIFAGLDALRLAAPLPTSGGRPGDRRSRARGRGVELADFRPYTPGDDLRLVDWNVFARLEQVLVRLFHEDRDLSLLVVVILKQGSGCGPWSWMASLSWVGSVGSTAVRDLSSSADSSAHACPTRLSATTR